MNRGRTETVAVDEKYDVAEKTSPALGTIALRFVTLLAAIVVVFTWTWTR